VVDAHELDHAAREHRRSRVLPDPETLLDLRGELHPGCWDSWLVFDRERLRHEAIDLLESAGQACLSRGDVHLATLLGLRAVECDPLRESANLLVVQSRLAAGDLVGAIQYGHRYAKLLADELSIPPPSSLKQLLWRHRREREHITGVSLPAAAVGVAG
jgi:DNA-binding SARP family transcriptional activator